MVRHTPRFHRMTDLPRGVLEGVGFAVGSTLASTFVYLLSKYPLEYFHTFSFCFYWYGLGFLYHVIYFAVSGRLALLRIPAGVPSRLAVLMVVESISNLSFFRALHLLDPALASFLNQLNVVLIVLIGVLFLGERFNRVEAVGMIVALIGVVAIRFASPAIGEGSLAMRVTKRFLPHQFSVCFPQASRQYLKHRNCHIWLLSQLSKEKPPVNAYTCSVLQCADAC